MRFFEKGAGYKPRTLWNARNAELTVAFAVDFNTAGEKLTQREADGRIVNIPLKHASVEGAAGAICAYMGDFDARILNIAGNGIYTLLHTGWTQTKLNRFVLDVLRKVQETHHITRILSGGQTGADTAGAVAGEVLGIDTWVTLPIGFKRRLADGVDVTCSEDALRKELMAQVEALR